MDGSATKTIEIAFDSERSDGYLFAKYCDFSDTFDLWMEFQHEGEFVLPEAGSGRVTTHGGGDYSMTRETAIALRDFLLYCFPLTPNAIGQGSAACGASPAPTGCASGG